MSYESTLEKLKGLAKKFEEQKQQRNETEKKESPQFSPFQFMRTDEDGLSYILCFLLDPEESHGQQLLFLEQFLTLLQKQGIDSSLLEFNKEEKNISVSVHQPTTQGRYHDIFIKTYNWVMSIESKLRNAVEQHNQIYDYIEDMERKNKENHFMIFLNTSKEKEPKTGDKKWDDLKEKNKAIVIDPEFLYNWLSNCEDKCQSCKIKDFIGYFKSFLDELFDLNKEENLEEDKYSFELDDKTFNEIWEKFKDVDFLNENIKEFNQLIRVVKHNPKYYEQITTFFREKLKEQLSDKLSETEYELDTDYSLHQVNTIYPIYFKPKFSPDNQTVPFWICYEDQGKGYWAIFWHTKDREKYQELANLFSNIQVEMGANATPKYPIWNHCSQKELAFWNDESWIKILDGTLIQDLWGNIDYLIKNEKIIACLKNS